MSKQKLIIALIILFVLGAGGYYWSSQKQAKLVYTGPVEKITIGAPGVVPEFQSLFFIAEEQGYFAKQGLEVSIEPKNTSVKINQELKDGTLDLGLVTDFTFVRDSFKSDDIKILAVLGELNIASIIGRTDKGIRKPSDLKGKKVAIIPKTAAEFFLDRYLIIHNLSLQDIEIVPITQAEQVSAALVEGKVDAIVFINKAVAELKQELKESVVSWSVQNGQPLYLMLVTNQETLPVHKEAFKRLLAALIQASDYLKINQAGALELIGKHLSAEDSVYLTSHWQDFNFGVSLSQDLLLLMEEQGRWIIKNQLPEKHRIPNFLNFIYFDLLETLRPGAVTIIH